LSFSGLGEIKTNDEFYTFIECGFARAKEERSERHAARPGNAGDFRLRLKGGQGNGPICGGQGMRNIAPESGCVADLRARDQVTSFDQCLGVRANQRVERNAIDRDGGTNVELVTSQFERDHLRDESQIN
jgi:hypothetical protein